MYRLHASPHLTQKNLAVGILVLSLIAGIVGAVLLFQNFQTQKTREAQRKLLVPPEKAGLTKEMYEQQVSQLSEKGTVITMGPECDMSPLILRLTTGDSLQVHNTDGVEHVIAFEDENFFAVSAGDTRNINITTVFGKKEGIYRYRCGESTHNENVGILYITPE